MASNYYGTQVVKKQLAKYRQMSEGELRAQAIKGRREQFSLRLQRATGQAAKPDQFGKARKNIARLKTVQRAARAAAATGGKK